ncbi:WD domain, G-beta repeat family protein [Leishmania donovani]|uniref:WD domain, G-beta repeat family protein n=1 Tax=Leishmania donovani TaxID=5661 RepID=A0A504X173_LEIDO|nr:WD domain, G-beta repeat family protein [Leishmania donovani]
MEELLAANADAAQELRGVAMLDVPAFDPDGPPRTFISNRSSSSAMMSEAMRRRANVLWRALYPRTAPPTTAAVATSSKNGVGADAATQTDPPCHDVVRQGIVTVVSNTSGEATSKPSASASSGMLTHKRARDGDDIVSVNPEQLKARSALVVSKAAAEEAEARKYSPPPKWRLAKVLVGHQGWVWATAVEPGNKWFATGSFDAIIKVWDLETGVLKMNLTGHKEAVRSISLSKVSPYMFSGSDDHSVKCWDLERNEVVREFFGHKSATVRVFDLRSRAVVHTMLGHTDSVMSLVVQQEEPQVISGGSDGFIYLWDLASGKPLQRLTRHKKPVRGLAFTAAGDALVSCGADEVRVWKLPSGHFVTNASTRVLDGHKSRPATSASAGGADEVGSTRTASDDVSYCSYASASGSGHERVTRILVVGEASVGKTLLIRRLCDHIFGDTSITSTDELADDDLGPKWGPTVGIAVDALKRTTTVLDDTVTIPNVAMSTPYDTAAMTRYTAPPSNLHSGENGNYPSCSVYGTPCSTAATEDQTAASPPRRQTVLQTVEFHELGGTHGYRDVARMLLRNIHYDGVMFVYHRRSLTSTLYLKEWYRWIRSVLSASPDIGSDYGAEANKPAKSSKTMPRFMLVGTQLPGDELPAAVAGLAKTTAETLHMACGAISDETLLDGNLEVKLRALQSPQTLTQRRGVRHALGKVLRRLAWPYHVWWCVSHPFFLLSKQYQEELGPRSRLGACGSRVVERFVWLLYQAEQALMYVMAVILFGPYQEAVVLGHSRLKQTLEEMLKDELCVSQAHVCRLDSNMSLQSSLDDVVAFFDILLRQDAPDEGR